MKRIDVVTAVALAVALLPAAGRTEAADVFLRARVTRPAEGRVRLTVSGFRHEGPQWTLPTRSAEAEAGAWSDWIDLREFPLHGRMERVGGLAEWPSLTVTVTPAGSGGRIAGCALEVQLADAADETRVVTSFTERSESDRIGFLLPHPLREHADEFETGSQMTARHLAWAREITGGEAIRVRRFDICTTLWGHYDPGLARDAIETLRLVGFNVAGGVPTAVLRDAGMRLLGKTWDWHVDPDELERVWRAFRERLPARLADEDERWEYTHMRHYVISDEVKVLVFHDVEPARRNAWFRDYLRARGVTERDLGRPLSDVELPVEWLEAKALPREADLPARRLAYHAAKFAQGWSAARLRQTTDGVKAALPGMRTETLPSSHGFFDAWGPPHIGMSHAMLDLFELGAQQAVDVLSAEDWLGLNHMYGPSYTWTGAQSFACLSAVTRSAIADKPMTLLGLITPSDDKYLRLKAYSCLGQGAKAFYFWTFGPTYIGTENYWSDLRSEYEGIARFTRDLERTEHVLADARVVSDPVAVLYSVSHDIWHSDQPAAFVEKRLLWHALRHLSVQPDFLREEDVEAGRLGRYRALFITDWCISRKATAAIDDWVQRGGVVYLSAGAATRDEHYEPHVPSFAQAVWPDEAASSLVQEGHRYNERTDLPKIEPLTHASLRLGGVSARLPVIGCRLNLRPDAASPWASFEDGSPAGATVRRGEGRIMAAGWLPMLAYGRLAGFQPTTLAEKWPPEPREIVRHVLDLAGIRPVARASVPVVETSLLTGPQGSALVLANYTYEPIASLAVDVKLPAAVRKAASCAHGELRLSPIPDGVRLTLPLEWTDIILLEP